jgi:hypothetical protein
MADCKACNGTGICSNCKGKGFTESYKLLVGSSKCTRYAMAKVNALYAKGKARDKQEVNRIPCLEQ